MFEYIMKFFNNPSPQLQINLSKQTQPKNYLFNKEYRNSYKKLWIDKLRDYRP